MKQRPFAVFDIDGTLIRWQLYHAIADSLAKSGHLKKSIYDEVRNARMSWKRREHGDAFKVYESRMVEAYEQMFESLSVEQFLEAAELVFTEYKDQVYTYTRGLISSLKKQGYLMFAISGSQHEVVKMIADYYEFDDFQGTVYEQADGRFTGQKQVASHIKQTVLQRLIKKHNATLKGSIGVGDSPGDIPMLEMVENPIAFNPDSKLFAAAADNGWEIVIERKNVVYKLEPKNNNYVLKK